MTYQDENLTELARRIAGKTADQASALIREAGYHEIKTIETYPDLEALADGTIIRDSDSVAGFIALRVNGKWDFTGLRTPRGELFKDSHVGLPATVLDGPEPA